MNGGDSWWDDIKSVLFTWPMLAYIVFTLIIGFLPLILVVTT